MSRSALTASLLGALLLTTGCFGGRGDLVHDGDWLAASPILEQQLLDEAQRLPWTSGFERLEQIRWFASVGEPGYETLLKLVQDKRPDVAAAALAALGATLDRRLVPAIRDVPWPAELLGSDLALERSRTLLRLGDWSEIPSLIRGLRDERLYTRALCAEALLEATRERHDYDARAAERDRERAVMRWEQWWVDRTNDGLLSGN